ncbi:MAG: hypothetical protein NTU44_10290 [Bacteroidetes bacterium]|nr:hypothetical protein [Bacteroidota bacterium]
MARFFTVFVIVCLSAGWANQLEAQCCSPGSPVGSTSSVGVVKKSAIRSITFFKHSFSDTYFKGGKPAEMQDATANFNYIGQMVSYGITDRLTVEGEFGYYLNKTKKYKVVGIEMKDETSGISNSVFSLKYCLLHTLRELEITVGAGAKVPLTQKPVENQFGPMPEDLQPSTGAYGFVGQLFISQSFPMYQFRAILLNRYEINKANPRDYTFGNAWFTSLFLSKSFLKHCTGLLQFRNENRKIDKEGKIDFTSSGGNVFIIAPQFSYTFPYSWNVAVMADFPVSRDYHGVQLGPKYSVGVSVVKGIRL